MNVEIVVAVQHAGAQCLPRLRAPCSPLLPLPRTPRRVIALGSYRHQPDRWILPRGLKFIWATVGTPLISATGKICKKKARVPRVTRARSDH
jgi:hypothetical protein